MNGNVQKIRKIRTATIPSENEGGAILRRSPVGTRVWASSGDLRPGLRSPGGSYCPAGSIPFNHRGAIMIRKSITPTYRKNYKYAKMFS